MLTAIITTNLIFWIFAVTHAGNRETAMLAATFSLTNFTALTLVLLQ